MKRALLIFLVACGGNDDLDIDTVTTLPPGDATGTAASGNWNVESLTVGCDGSCSTQIDGFLFSACDVGTRLDDNASLTQTDGRLVIDVDNSDYVSRLEGGLDADGSYDVGGFRTQQGGSITITARSTGTLTGDTMTGTARLLVSGNDLDCLIDVDTSGER